MTREEIIKRFRALGEETKLEIMAKVNERVTKVILGDFEEAIGRFDRLVMAELEAEVSSRLGSETAGAALELCEKAAGGCLLACPTAMVERFKSGTPYAWRAARVAEIVAAVKDGRFRGRETLANPRSYKDSAP